jgi:MoaA/NifB/PqqE/SkfB family radical SAM enzyme
MITEKLSENLIKKGISKEELEKRDELISGTTDKKEQFKNSCYEVMVHKLCNEKCFFCSQDHKSRTTEIKPNDADIYARILYGAKQWYGMLWFTGGEPLIHPHILKYIRFWRKAWFGFVRIQTNGVMLWKEKFVKECIDAGATLFKLSIHHYKSEIHDWLVWVPWALKNCEDGIKSIRKYGWRIWINIVLTEQNYRDLPEFLLHFLGLGVTSFVVIFPLYEHSMYDERNKVGFKFSDAIPFVLKSLKIFDKFGLRRPLVLNLPMCLLKWYESAIIQTFNGTAVLNLDGSKTNIDDNKAGGKTRVKICQDCEHNKICFGVDEKYIETWGDSEFQEHMSPLPENINIDDIPFQTYFTEDELCFLELLSRKSPLTIDDIIAMKDDIQICKDCDSMNKIITTGDILERKGFLKKLLLEWKIAYSKTRSLWV